MSDIPIIDPEINDTACWHFTCDKKAIAHDVSVINRFIIKIPVCSYHLAHPAKGKVGFFSNRELKFLNRFEFLFTIARWLDRRENRKG